MGVALKFEQKSAFAPASAPQIREVPLDPRAFAAITSREAAEDMLEFDHRNAGASEEWKAFFVEAFVGYLLWQSRPIGAIPETDLDWLMGMVGDVPSPSTPALLFALVREMNDAPERLTALAMRHGHGRLF